MYIYVKVPQESYILTEPRIACRQTGHFGDKSRSTEKAHLWQQTMCPHGTNADRRLLIRQITHNCPSGMSPTSSSSTTSDSELLLLLSPSTARFCSCALLYSHHCFHLFQFLKENKKQSTEIRLLKTTKRKYDQNSKFRNLQQGKHKFNNLVGIVALYHQEKMLSIKATNTLPNFYHSFDSHCITVVVDAIEGRNPSKERNYQVQPGNMIGEHNSHTTDRVIGDQTKKSI